MLIIFQVFPKESTKNIPFQFAKNFQKGKIILNYYVIRILSIKIKKLKK